jgi:SAM-dependent methyltransferase
MDQATRARLNALNRRFYAEHAAAFSQTRGRPWPGFMRALAQTAAVLATQAAGAARVRVLDMGCGNGRLITALRTRFGAAFEYVGVDASEPLLAIARERHPDPQLRFVRADFVADPPDAVLPAGPFELCALFGLLHHVPDEAARAELLRAAAARLAPGGVLAFTLWRFDAEGDLERRRARAPSLSAELAQLQLDAGDYLLRFGDHAVRYCHLCDDAEAERLRAAAGLPLLDRFRADGAGGRQNDYILLHAPGA